MRVLSKKQRKLVEKWFDENWDGAGSLYTYCQMPIELQEELEKIGDHETLWQNLDRFINDLAMEKLYG